MDTALRSATTSLWRRVSRNRNCAILSGNPKDPTPVFSQSPAGSAVPTSRNSMAGKVCEKSSTRNLAILLGTARDPAPVLV